MVSFGTQKKTNPHHVLKSAGCCFLYKGECSWCWRSEKSCHQSESFLRVSSVGEFLGRLRTLGLHYGSKRRTVNSSQNASMLVLCLDMHGRRREAQQPRKVAGWCSRDMWLLPRKHNRSLVAFAARAITNVLCLPTPYRIRDMTGCLQSLSTFPKLRRQLSPLVDLAPP